MEIIITTLKIKGIKDEQIPIEIIEQIMKIWLPVKQIIPIEELIEIRESKIHGNGIFAKRKIEKNKVINLYPCEGVIIKDILYTKNENKGEEKFDIGEYKIKLKGEENKYIYGNPSITKDKKILGHLINESYDDVINIDKEMKIEEFGKKYIDYMLKSLKKNNSVLISTENYVYVKTIKEIEEGEELITSYGFNYWCKRMKNEEVEIKINKYLKMLTETQINYVMSLFKQMKEIHSAKEINKETQEVCIRLKNNPSLIFALLNKQLNKQINKKKKFTDKNNNKLKFF